MRNHRRFVAGLVASTLSSAFLSVGPPIVGLAAPMGVAWSKCYAQFGPFECGTVQVPLDYSQPNGATISIALVRLPASDPVHRIGSLFLNPGGPGGSGMDMVLNVGQFLYSDEVRARFDMVGFDPRGTNRSTALRCFGTPKQWGPYFTPFAYPTTPAEEQVVIAANQYLDNACAQRGFRLSEHMATADVARDMDRLRQAVGDAKLNYAGVSYGSFLGVTYANLFPGNIRAMIVDGVLDPIDWTTGYGSNGATVPFSTRLGSSVSAEATLQEFFRLCDTGSNCAFAPNSAARFEALGAKLKQQPVQVVLPDGSTIYLDYSILIGITLNALYYSPVWEDFARLLASLEDQVDTATLGTRLQPFLAVPAYITKRGIPRYYNMVESFPAIACADSDNPHSYSAWSAAGATADASSHFGRIWTWASSICAKWPFTDSNRYTGPFNASTPEPVLVVGNEFDPATPYQGAVTVSHLLGKAGLLTLHAWGHTSLFLSSCADSVASTYLLHIALPAPGTVCEQDHIPFT